MTHKGGIMSKSLNTYWYYAKGSEYLQGNFVNAETIGKARYKIWKKGASAFYENFGDFLKVLKIKKVKEELIEKALTILS